MAAIRPRDLLSDDLLQNLGHAKRGSLAGDIARLGVRAFRKGEQLPPERALPVYLRDTVATPKA